MSVNGLLSVQARWLLLSLEHVRATSSSAVSAAR